MKRKMIYTTLLITIGIVIGGVVGCSSKNNVQAEEKGYLNYCGTQYNILGDKTVAVYEDTKHNKVIYIGSDNFQHPVSIAVSDWGMK